MGEAKELTFMFKVKIYPKDDGDYLVYPERPFQVGKDKPLTKKKTTKKVTHEDVGSESTGNKRLL